VKICFVVPSLADGGAERVAVTVLSALDASRYERMLYLFSGSGVYFDRIAPDVRVVTASRRSWIGRLFELAAFLRATRPDIVMPFLSYFITAMAASLSRTRPRVIFNQGTPTTQFLRDADFSWRLPLRRAVFSAFTRWFYRRADAVVVTSAGVAEDLVAHYGVARTQVRVLHNPVDLETIERAAQEPVDRPASEHDPVIAAAGRLAGVKNYPLFIEAIARIAGRRPVVAWILGEGHDRPQLEALAAAHNLRGIVRFLGFQRNPWQFMARADVFVLTSTYEGFGNVLIEAMACGTAVVATRSPGTVEIIHDGANGLLVDHNPDAVAAAVSRLIDDPALRARFVTAARASVERYALPRVVERYDRLFEEIAVA
jgi:glycosyltransferase involved in cell wall biosynthesis